MCGFYKLEKDMIVLPLTLDGSKIGSAEKGVCFFYKRRAYRYCFTLTQRGVYEYIYDAEIVFFRRVLIG